jgi:hypothetical protein
MNRSNLGAEPSTLSDAVKKGAVEISPDPIPTKTFTPFGCLIAVHVFKMHEPGLAMPDGVIAPNKTPTMLVIAAGPKCEQVKEGDMVYPAGNFMAINVYSRGGKVMVCREDQVSGVLIPGPDGKV